MQFIDDEPAPPPPRARRSRGPWHLRPVALAALLWNGFGALQYVMAQSRNPDYFALTAQDLGIAPEMLLAYADSFPAWTYAAWALGVFGGVAGAVLLLLRRRHALWAFAVSLAGLAATQLHRLTTPQPAWAEQAGGMTLAIWGIAIGLLIYALWLRRRGVLS